MSVELHRVMLSEFDQTYVADMLILFYQTRHHVLYTAIKQILYSCLLGVTYYKT